ncbi:hypothetical protein HZA73_00060 [candidate division TA06 bacterium]|nr:hypothetical protein [candidate division TA06 bacterium]
MKKNIYDMTSVIAVLILALTMSLEGCSKPMAPEHTNPADLLNPNFLAPGASIVYPGEGATLTGSVDTVRWTRVGSAQEFNWQIDNMGWHGWKTDTFAIISNASEGSHTVMVLARDGGDGSYFDTTKVAVRHYIKNRYNNSIMLYPLSQTVAAGDTVTMWCELEDMTTPAAGVKLTIYAYPYALDTIGTGADTGMMWIKNGGSPLGPFFSTSSYQYYFDLNMGVAGGTPAGVTGSGRICKFKLEAKSSGSIYIVSADVRDTLNNTIAGITYPNNCYVTVTGKKEGGK